MGAWGDGIWQNDDAMDLAASDIDEATLARAIRAMAHAASGWLRVSDADRKAMQAVFRTGTDGSAKVIAANFLQWHASLAYAAGALVAIARGRPGRVVPRPAWWALRAGGLAKVGLDAAMLVEAALADDQRPGKYEAKRGPGKRYFAERRDLLQKLRQPPQDSLAVIQRAKVQADVGDPLGGGAA